ncbi:MAG: hypothetical protein KatS3mg109_0387 [Pirellulaceae bacterium]|nr:MAG: hypothetical protein KatS3mg109_0387 [Pirellulaceae bacterium]
MLVYSDDNDTVQCPVCGVHTIEREEGFEGVITPIVSPGCEHIGEFELLDDGRFEFVVEEE